MNLFSVIHSGEFYATFCGLLWAVAVVLFRKSGEQVEPMPLNLFKCTVALALLLLGMPVVGVSWFPAERSVQDWGILVLSGVVGIGVADSVFFASLNRLGAGRSAIVDCLYSPLIIICSSVYLQEPVGPRLLLGLGLLITAILIGAFSPEQDNHPHEKHRLRVGVALGVVSMSAMAVGIVIAKPVLDRCNPWWVTTVRLWGGMVLLAAQAATKKHRAGVIACFRPGPLWKVNLPAAFIGGFLAMLFWIMGMKYTYTTTASVLNQLSTIFVIILATLFLKEPLTPRKGVAVVMGFFGAVIASTTWPVA